MQNIVSGLRRFSFYRLQLVLCLAASSAHAQSQALSAITIGGLAEQLQVGDMVFIHVDILPFRKIAHDTKSWTNHVGIVIDASGAEPVIAESTFPFSKTGQLSKFIRRSKAGRVAVARLNTELTSLERVKVKEAAFKRLGIFYDTGFNLHSNRQFCSRYVNEVIHEATGRRIGNIENFQTLFADNPDADLLFWRIWYFGRIPWMRETITPASLLNSPDVHVVFDWYTGNASK